MYLRLHTIPIGDEVSSLASLGPKEAGFSHSAISTATVWARL